MQVRGKEYVNRLQKYGVTDVQVINSNSSMAEDIRVVMNSETHYASVDVGGLDEYQTAAAVNRAIRNIVAGNYKGRLQIPDTEHTHSYTADPREYTKGGMVCSVCLKEIRYDDLIGIWVAD